MYVFPEIVILDCETTGFKANGEDRMVEIALVRATQNGKIVDEFTTLLNPDRSVGASHIHGIRQSDVANAPRFSDISGHFLRFTRDSVIVGHNVAFDARFAIAELIRAGVAINDLPVTCTLNMARRAVPGLSSYKLTDLCRHFSISPGAAHTALDDARATLELAMKLNQVVKGDHFVGVLRDEHANRLKSWPSSNRFATPLRRNTQHRVSTEPLTVRLAKHVPALSPNTVGQAQYASVLHRVLEDGQISDVEFGQLVDVAKSYLIDMTDVVAVHRQFMMSLTAAAIRDSQVTRAEVDYVQKQGTILGFSPTDVSQFWNFAAEDAAAAIRQSVSTFRNGLSGQSLCFAAAPKLTLMNGKATLAYAEATAIAEGATIHKTPTAKTTLIVVPRTNKLPIKLQKARSLKVPEISESTFWILCEKVPIDG